MLQIGIFFEKDPLNSSNEGFIEFWYVLSENSNNFRHGKSLTKQQGLLQWMILVKQGWKVLHEYELVG